MGICCSQGDTVENTRTADESVHDKNISEAPLLPSENRVNMVYNSSNIHVDIEDKKSSGSAPIATSISKIHLTKTNSIDNECIVCFEKFSKLHPPVVKRCKCGPNTQNYHLSCILSWKERSEFCPVCGSEIQILDENSEPIDL